MLSGNTHGDQRRSGVLLNFNSCPGTWSSEKVAPVGNEIFQPD